MYICVDAKLITLVCYNTLLYLDLLQLNPPMHDQWIILRSFICLISFRILLFIDLIKRSDSYKSAANRHLYLCSCMYICAHVCINFECQLVRQDLTCCTNRFDDQPTAGGSYKVNQWTAESVAILKSLRNTCKPRRASIR